MDTIIVALQVVPTELVIVVTDDELVTAEMQRLGVTTLADPGRGLNDAVRVGLDEADRRRPAHPAAVLLGDLPALRPEELYDGLRACAAAEAALVPDHDGQGTVLLTHHDSSLLSPQFGRGSAARHARHCTVMDLDLPTLRHDVDDLASLQAALEMGVGEWSSRVLSATARRSA